MSKRGAPMSFAWQKAIKAWERGPEGQHVKRPERGATMLQAAALASDLVDRADPDGSNCYPSGRGIEERLGIARRIVSQLFQRWESAGWIIDTGERRNGGVTVWQLTIPDNPPDPRTLAQGGGEVITTPVIEGGDHVTPTGAIPEAKRSKREANPNHQGGDHVTPTLSKGGDLGGDLGGDHVTPRPIDRLTDRPIDREEGASAAARPPLGEGRGRGGSFPAASPPASRAGSISGAGVNVEHQRDLGGRVERDIPSLANALRLRWNFVASRTGAMEASHREADDGAHRATEQGASGELSAAIAFLESYGPGSGRQPGESDREPRPGEKLWSWFARVFAPAPDEARPAMSHQEAPW